MITLTETELHSLVKDAYYEGYMDRSERTATAPVSDVLGQWKESESRRCYQDLTEKKEES